MSKKAPKRSKRKSRKTKEKQENLIIAAIFIIFVGVIGYLFYFVEMPSFNEDVVATVNGDKITRDQLDWWYKISIIPEFREVVAKQDFLVLSLIPQEVLVQKAKEEKVKATKDDVEKLLGLYIIENGLDLDEFEEHLNSRSLSLEDIKKSFETRAIIMKLLEEEGIDFEGEGSFFGADTLQVYMDNLIENSDIEIFPENVDKLVLRSFEATGDELCDEEKPIVRLYTTSFCEACDESGRLFQDLVIDFIIAESIQARHWSLDSGDNLLTLKEENGIPEEEVEIFKKYSPKKLVPAIVIGCKYKYVGKFGAEEADEFKDILKEIII